MHSLAQQKKLFYYFLLAILLVHGAFMIVKLRDRIEMPKFTATQEAIKIKLIADAMKELSATKRQIVQSEDPAELKRPITESFHSDKDRSFDRQTVSKTVDIFNKAALGNANVNNKAVAKAESQSKKPSLKDLKLSDVGIGAIAMPVAPARNPASNTVQGRENGDLNSQGLSATNDYVQEVPLGDFTQLNTVEFKFYGFYHRIRQKLEQYWGRSIQEKAEALFKSGRRLPASENLITNLQVTLDSEGEIVGVKILGASGVRELDDAAIESFNQAGPFPNPPKELLVNGKVTIDWGFVVKS
jgi:TonB family protein